MKSAQLNKMIREELVSALKEKIEISSTMLGYGKHRITVNGIPVGEPLSMNDSDTVGLWLRTSIDEIKKIIK